MSLPWQLIEKHLNEYRKEVGWKGGPCLRLTMRSGDKYLICRTIEASDTIYAALTFLPEETIDETPRFHLIAVDPKEVVFVEAFEPEPRSPEQIKRYTFTIGGGRGERTDKYDRGGEKPAKK